MSEALVYDENFSWVTRNLKCQDKYILMNIFEKWSNAKKMKKSHILDKDEQQCHPRYTEA